MQIGVFSVNTEIWAVFFPFLPKLSVPINPKKMTCVFFRSRAFFFGQWPFFFSVNGGFFRSKAVFFRSRGVIYF